MDRGRRQSSGRVTHGGGGRGGRDGMGGGARGGVRGNGR